MPAKNPLSYQERTYRSRHDAGLVATEVKMAETDLHILADRPAEELALLAVAKVRAEIEGYIRQHPLFLNSLAPLPMDSMAPKPVQEMLAAALAAGVGPMAAVAGVIAETVGRALLKQGMREVIVENGGDLFVARTQPCVVAIHAGTSRLSGKLGISLRPEQMPCGLCCSSGTVGHSLSFGAADAAAVLAPSAALADAAATRLGNEVKNRNKKSVSQAVATARGIKGIAGLIVIAGDHLGAWGDVELTRLQSNSGCFSDAQNRLGILS
jgi:ApbE superfamily uncharacterized protein (UPF0280 family)